MSGPEPEARRLHPASLIVRWLKIVPQMLAGGIGLAATASHEGIRRFILFAMFAALAGALFALLSWWRFRYTIGPGEIVIEKGVISRQRRVIPFDRVQDIAIERGLIARLFGTARVRVETGGAAKDEGELDMVALDEAHALRDRVRHGTRAGAAEAAPPAPEPVLFALDLPRLLLSGLFGFSLVFLAAIATLVQQLDQFNFVDWDEWFTAERAEAASHLATLQTALVLAVLIVMAGTVAGLVRTVLRDFGFRLTRTEAGLQAPARALHLVGGGDPAAPHPGGFGRQRPRRARVRLVSPLLPDPWRGPQGRRRPGCRARSREWTRSCSSSPRPASRRRRARAFAAARAGRWSAGPRPGSRSRSPRRPPPGCSTCAPPSPPSPSSSSPSPRCWPGAPIVTRTTPKRSTSATAC